LLAAATSGDLLVVSLHRPGDFVVEGECLARIHGAEPDGEACRQIRSAFILGPRRTATQDPEFVLFELVEIAVRALSPGVNDPRTAMSCTDYIVAALCRLQERGMPRRVLADEEGRPRVWLDQTSFTGICNAGLDQIRQHGRTDVAVTARLLEGLAAVARRASTDEQREAVMRQARMVMRGARDLPEELDRQAIEERFALVEAALPESHNNKD
jgi:uncharacterized membrane protein